VGGLLGGLDVSIGKAKAIPLAIGRSDVFSPCYHTAGRTRGIAARVYSDSGS
jgi:hypothetical protein